MCFNSVIDDARCSDVSFDYSSLSCINIIFR